VDGGSHEQAKKAPLFLSVISNWISTGKNVAGRGVSRFGGGRGGRYREDGFAVGGHRRRNGFVSGDDGNFREASGVAP